MRVLFPGDRFRLRHRISSSEQAMHKEYVNGVRARFDIVGFQVAPYHAKDIVRAINILERQNSWPILFRFNTFPFSENDFTRLIGPDSCPFYRAIHYYVNIGGACAEIQLRTPAIDQWSMIHHATLYKPVIDTTKEEECAVLEFGFVANWVDFSDLLQP